MKTMMTTKALSFLLIFPFGCSMMQAPGDGQRPIEDLIPTIQQRVQFASQIAFAIESVKPHKEAVCQVVGEIAAYLDSYDDPDANLDRIRQLVLAVVDNIANEQVREAARAATELMLSEAFHFAWQHYSDFINRDETQAAILIAKAVAEGMREACLR